MTKPKQNSTLPENHEPTVIDALVNMKDAAYSNWTKLPHLTRKWGVQGAQLGLGFTLCRTAVLHGGNAAGLWGLTKKTGIAPLPKAIPLSEKIKIDTNYLTHNARASFYSAAKRAGRWGAVGMILGFFAEKPKPEDSRKSGSSAYAPSHAGSGLRPSGR